MVGSFSSNSTAAQELAASVGMRTSSILEPPGSAVEGDESDIMDPTGLDPQLTGPGRGKHTSAAAAAVGGGDGAGGSSSGVENVADAVSRELPDPAEAARRILQELGRTQLSCSIRLCAVVLLFWALGLINLCSAACAVGMRKASGTALMLGVMLSLLGCAQDTITALMLYLCGGAGTESA